MRHVACGVRRKTLVVQEFRRIDSTNKQINESTFISKKAVCEG